ncbi:hypothetical protein [Paenibacillus solani]|nr:hypothetical protein [Paenibacillus solani]
MRVKELEKLTNTYIHLTMLPLKDFDSSRLNKKPEKSGLTYR